MVLNSVWGWQIAEGHYTTKVFIFPVSRLTLTRLPVQECLSCCCMLQKAEESRCAGISESSVQRWRLDGE